MTEQIKSAISIIENEKECVQSDCDRDCSRCELVKEESEIVGAFDLSIRSLQAWEEVLNELEQRVKTFSKMCDKNPCMHYEDMEFAYMNLLMGNILLEIVKIHKI